MRAVLILTLLLVTPAQAAPLKVCDEVDVLLGTAGPDCSLCSGYPGPRKKPKQKLSNAQLRAAVARGKINRHTARCGRGHEGTSRMRVTVEPSGEVSRAVLVHTTGADGVDRCLMAVVRRVRFPESEGGATFTMPVRY